MTTSAAAVPRALLDKFHAKGVTIRQQYGTSESSGAITNPEFELALRCPESAGFPLPTFDLEIRDGDGTPLPPVEGRDDVNAAFWLPLEDARSASLYGSHNMLIELAMFR